MLNVYTFSRRGSQPRALVITPTRELCQQVTKLVEYHSLSISSLIKIFLRRSIQSLSDQLRCISLYGGVPYGPQVGEREGEKGGKREGERRRERESEREREGGRGGERERERERRVRYCLCVLCCHTLILLSRRKPCVMELMLCVPLRVDLTITWKEGTL